MYDFEITFIFVQPIAAWDAVGQAGGLAGQTNGLAYSETLLRKVRTYLSSRRE